MNTAQAVRRTPAGRTKYLPTNAALAITWMTVAALSVVNLFNDDAIDLEEINTAASLALAAAILRATQAIVTSLETHRSYSVTDVGTATGQVTIAINQLHHQLDATNRRVESLQGLIAEFNAVHGERCELSAAKAAEAVIGGVRTVRDLQILTAEQIAAAEGNARIAVLNGRSKRGAR